MKASHTTSPYKQACSSCNQDVHAKSYNTRVHPRCWRYVTDTFLPIWHFKKHSAIFNHYFTSIEEGYTETMDEITALHPDCAPLVPGVPFSSFTLNVGEHSVCRARVDGQNMACGLCLICPLGTFNPTRSRHLILHDMKLILEIALGSIALIPSALITHENIPIRPEESRQAITAYTP